MCSEIIVRLPYFYLKGSSSHYDVFIECSEFPMSKTYKVNFKSHIISTYATNPKLATIISKVKI